MRLRIKRQLLEQAAPFLDLNAQARHGHAQTIILDFINLKNAVDKIALTHLFDSAIDEILKLNFWNTYSNSITIDNDVYGTFNAIITTLRNSVNKVILSFNSIISEDNQFVISIKIPSPKSFRDLADVSKSLDLIFGQTIHHSDINGSIEIKNFDMGSFWIDILVNGGAQVMHFISALAWGGAVTYKKIMEGKLIAEQVRELKISNDAKEETFKGLKELQNSTASKEAAHIANEHLTNYDNEDIKRIEHAINEIAKLYTKGAEIHPSLEAPQEIVEEFPKMDKISTLDSKIKLISEG